MKKFTTTFFLLMAMVLLLPTELKAAEDMRLLTVQLTDRSYNNFTSKLYFNYDAVNSRYYYDVKSFAGDLYFRIGIKGWSNDIQPKSDKASVPTSEGSASNAEYGKTNAWKVNIKDKKAMDEEDLECLEDMIKIAVNDAYKQIDAEIEKKMGMYSKLAGGLF